MKVPKYITLEKPRGKTPLEVLNVWRQSNPMMKDVLASYAGRLDPMAEGKLLVLLGDECKKQHLYTKLDKEYLIRVVFDLESDTGDVLGLPTYSDLLTSPSALNSGLFRALKSELGSHVRKYPVFSSKTVAGKPLFVYALEGTLDSLVIPEHSETIHRISLQNVSTYCTKEMHAHLQELLAAVPRSSEPSKTLGADFRQDQIREEWKYLFENIPEREFAVATIRVICGSGAYMRTLASRLGESLGTHALALSINRTKIGKFKTLGQLGMWSKTY